MNSTNNLTIGVTVDQLTIPEEGNPRKSPASAEQDAELEASIAHHGVLQNIIVQPHLATATEPGIDGSFRVIAGSRRVRAVMRLIEQGDIDKDYEIPAIVRGERDATEIAIQENTARAAMATLDELEAMTRLRDQQSYSIDKLATAFGRSSREVRKTLALGGVAQEIRDHCRAGKMNMDALEAFTLEEDQQRQLSIFKRVKKEAQGNIWPHAVREAIRGESIPNDDMRVEFIGLDAYRDAGGDLVEDLFSRGGGRAYVKDEKLLEDLVSQKIKAIDEQLTAEGWAWVKFDQDFNEYSVKDHYKVIEGTLTEAGEKLLQEERDLEEELEQLNEDWDEGKIEDADASQRDEQINDRLNEIPILVGAETEYSDAQKAKSGVIWKIQHDGRPLVLRGLTEKKSAVDKAKDSRASTEHPEKYSQALRQDLQTVKHLAASHALTKDQAFAIDLLHFQVIVKALGDRFFYESPLTVQVDDVMAPPAEGFITSNHGSVEFFEQENSKIREKIEEFLDPEDACGSFMKFRELPAAEKKRLLTFAIAQNLSGESWTNPTGFLSAILDKTKFNIATVWKPTAENYFGRIKKPLQLELVAALFDQGTADDFAGKNRNELAELLEEKVSAMADKVCWLPEFCEEV